MTPQDFYKQDLSLGGILADPQQQEAVSHLQRVYDALQAAEQGWRSWKISRHFKPTVVKGLYLWGGVGIGKTYLMDLFYRCLTVPKMRLHFHAFMRDVHHALKEKQGEQDPLIAIAQDLSKKTRILCFDEFFVKDITDAMILGRLTQTLFEKGVTMVATSNVAPDDLYKNGLQRALFLPAIASIKQHMTVMNLESICDYRLRQLENAGLYFYPLDWQAEENMRESFERFARGIEQDRAVITIQDRPIQTQRLGENVVWFRFDDLCTAPRSQLDYLEIAQRYPIMLLSHIPKISEEKEATINYFINLIDVLYDCAVKLIASFEVPLNEIYMQGRYTFEFRRTLSRLEEMQSKAYLSLPHRG